MDSEEGQELVSSGEGSWLSFLKLDDEIVWRITDEVPLWLEHKEVMSDGTKVLPSDMERRADIPPMISKDWKTAETIKHEMEEQQRADQRLRDAAAKRRETQAKKDAKQEKKEAKEAAKQAKLEKKGNDE